MTKTRLAPSPTGFLHVGTLRTALYNYLLAKKDNGVFFLRIEDTDQAREVPGAIENLLKMLQWAGIAPDEGVLLDENGQVVEKGELGSYVQSKRLGIYHNHVEELIQKGQAYYCFCTAERLAQMREEQIRLKRPPMYDRACLNLTPETIAKNKEEVVPFIIRQKIPRERQLIAKDLIRGKVKFDCATLDDQVLLKSDGFPTYHLAHVVDDHLMQTTHVIRGEEWLPSLPKHLLLFEAFGWEPPFYAHLPLLLNQDKSKLSKRSGAKSADAAEESTVSVEYYQKKGYLPGAVINFVAFLGWNPGSEQEIFTLPELINAFSLDRVHKAGAVFDLNKLDWFNGLYIRKLDLRKLAALARPYLETAGFPLPDYPPEYLEKCLALLQERLKNFAETPQLLKFFFYEPNYAKELIFNEKMQVNAENAPQILREVIQTLDVLPNFTLEKIKETLTALIVKLGLKNGQVLWPIRAVLTGEKFSPGAFEVASVLGKEKTLNRLQKGLSLLTV